MIPSIGSVSTSPDILAPIPCTNFGLLVITVPAPSQTVTVVSRRPRFSPVIMISDAPNPTKTSSSNWRLSVNIPKSLIRNSMFFLTSSEVIFLIPRTLSNIGHHSICGSPTSTTLPFSTTTFAFPSISITWGIISPFNTTKISKLSIRSSYIGMPFPVFPDKFFSWYGTTLFFLCIHLIVKCFERTIKIPDAIFLIGFKYIRVSVSIVLIDASFKILTVPFKYLFVIHIKFT